MNEFFYGETLRWSFGFENPNKAAVVFACLLPLCWWAWMAAWGIRRAGLRIPSLAFSAGVFLAMGGCLVMTFSRGGLVAGVAALGYVWALALWRNRPSENARGGTPAVESACFAGNGADGAASSRAVSPAGFLIGWQGILRSPKCWLSVFLIGLLAGLAGGSGLADRSASALGEDASVTNRFELWQAGLQMAYENPAGFGSGKSGREFMQWYQAPDRTEGYGFIPMRPSSVRCPGSS